MRLRVGHGPNDWLDHGPSTPLPPKGYSGGLVVGGPSQAEADRLTSKRHKKATAERVRAIRAARKAA